MIFEVKAYLKTPYDGRHPADEQLYAARVHAAVLRTPLHLGDDFGGKVGPEEVLPHAG